MVWALVNEWVSRHLGRQAGRAGLGWVQGGVHSHLLGDGRFMGSSE